MRLVADSHAVVWYAKGSPRLSAPARDALTGAETDGGIVVSVASLIDLWYVTLTTKSKDDLDRLRAGLLASDSVSLQPVTIEIVDAYVGIDRGALGDPWDRLIVATAQALELPLVTRDGQIRTAGLVETIW